MAAVDFPSSPTTGQTYFANGYGWQYNGTSWVPIAANSSFVSFSAGTLDGGGAASTTTSLTNPTTQIGTTPVWFGGTGVTNIPVGQMLVGNGTNSVTFLNITAANAPISVDSQPAAYSQSSSYSLI
jgi:hypothetical protein